MTKRKSGIYFENIEIDIRHAGVLSEMADACLVPQYADEISMLGVSSAFIHSRMCKAISSFRKFMVKNRPLPYGSAYACECDGNYRYLINVSVLGCPHDQAEDITQSTVSAALKEAEKKGVRTIVLPAVNTGSSGCLSYPVAAKVTFNAIIEYAKQAHTLKKITLALYTNEACETYWDALAALLKKE